MALPSTPHAVPTVNYCIILNRYVSPEVIDGGGSSAAVDFWSFGVLLYEMTFGHTPFAGSTMQETFANIVTKELKFPPKHTASREVLSSLRVAAPIATVPYVRPQVVDLIKRLLVKDPSRRLSGEDIQSHNFFAGVSWGDLTSTTPPLVPTLDSDDDGSYFPHVHSDAAEAAMLHELANERCHEGNPFFALSCRCSALPPPAFVAPHFQFQRERCCCGIAYASAPRISAAASPPHHWAVGRRP